MGKRSKIRRSRHERDEAGCIRGIISIFDFRHSRTTKRLLTDRSQVFVQALGAEDLSPITIPPDSPQNFVGDEESKIPMVDSTARTSVKKLMEEEMSNEHGSFNRSNCTEKDYEQVNTKHEHHRRKNSKRENRVRDKSSDMDATELVILKRLMHDQFLKDNLDLQSLIEELTHVNQGNTIPKHSSVGDDVIAEEIVVAVKMLMNNKHFGEEGKSHHCSKELMDALQTLISNNGLFLELLQDPNSILIQKIKNHEDSRATEDLRPDSLPGSVLLEKKQKSINLFRRRSKSFESFSMGKEEDSHSMNKIVILKPGSGDHIPDIDVAIGRRSFQSEHTPNSRYASQFSFTEIKRKLRYAMGKERNGISPERLSAVSPKQQNGKNAENMGWSSPNRNHFYSERFTKTSTSFKNGEQVKDNGLTTMNGNSRPEISNIYIEAKKHLSEIVNSAEISDSKSGKSPKSLGRMISFPDYSSSPCFSPRENGDNTFITAQMRLSPRAMTKSNGIELLHENHSNLPSPRRKSVEIQARSSCSNLNDEEQSSSAVFSIPSTSDQGCFLREDFITSEETIETMPPKEEKHVEEENSIGCFCESSSNSLSIDIANEEIREEDGEEIASVRFEDPPQSIKMDLIGEEPILSPPRKEVESYECGIDRIERFSPISVLDPSITEEDISPASTISRPVGKEIQPRHIHFEEQSSTIDQDPCIRISLEDEESAFEYVEAVLLGSGLNWDEFLLRWFSFEEILDLSLFDEVELFSSRSRYDQKFLFDLANEALKELCEIHFGGISRVSNTRLVPTGMNLINEVWERVELHLRHNPHPYSLDQLLKSDMGGSRKWTNLKLDIELIGCGMGDIIFDDLVEESILSFMDDTSKCEFQVLVDECYGNEDANL